MSSSERHFPKFHQYGFYLLTGFLSIALTLGAVRAFPNYLIPEYTSNRTDGITPPIRLTQNSQSIAAEPVKANFIVTAVNRVSPAVVRIDTERTIAQQVPDPFFDDPFFRYFFGEDALPNLPRTYRQHGQGSGFIIDRDGIILTNAHVVSGADIVTIRLKDGRTFQGKVRGIDELSDLAVIKIDGQNLPTVTLGNSSDLRVGDWAIAVGNPFGLDNTVTLGIISTLSRSSAQVGIPDKQLNFIQTDAAINPGNSGGPLLNERGEAIGINTAIRAQAQGIGFAIPIDTAKLIKDRLARGEKISHPYIGIRMISISPEAIEQFNKSNPELALTVPNLQGVLVVQVVPNSPAALAGLRAGDAIIAVDNQPVISTEQLQTKVASSKIGQSLQLKIYRGDQTEQLTVRPAEMPSL